MIRAYLLAFVLLALGLAGVALIASQASRSVAPSVASSPDSADVPVSQVGPAGAPRATPLGRPRPEAQGGRVVPAADAGLSGRVSPKAQDASVARADGAAGPGDAAVAGSLDAAVAPRRAVSPDAGGAGALPPGQAGSSPTLTVQFSVGSTHISRKARREVRKLVNEHGYKDVYYRLLGYGAERRRPKNNRALARRRCRKVVRLIRKRGVSRRWISCGQPVYRNVKRKPTEADRSPVWRKVEIRVEKP